MARTGVNQGLGDGVELGQHQRHEPLEIHILGQHSICPRHNFAHVRGVHRQRPQISAGFRHQQRGTDSVTGDIGDDNPKTAVGQVQVVKIIAPGCLRRIGGPGDVKGSGMR